MQEGADGDNNALSEKSEEGDVELSDVVKVSTGLR